MVVSGGGSDGGNGSGGGGSGVCVGVCFWFNKYVSILNCPQKRCKCLLF